MSTNGEFIFVSQSFYPSRNQSTRNYNAENFVQALIDEFGTYGRSTALMLDEKMLEEPTRYDWRITDCIRLAYDARHPDYGLTPAYWRYQHQTMTKILEIAPRFDVTTYFCNEYTELYTTYDFLHNLETGELVKLTPEKIVQWDKFFNYDPAQDSEN